MEKITYQNYIPIPLKDILPRKFVDPLQFSIFLHKFGLQCDQMIHLNPKTRQRNETNDTKPF